MYKTVTWIGYWMMTKASDDPLGYHEWIRSRSIEETASFVEHGIWDARVLRMDWSGDKRKRKTWLVGAVSIKSKFKGKDPTRKTVE